MIQKKGPSSTLLPSLPPTSPSGVQHHGLESLLQIPNIGPTIPHWLQKVKSRVSLQGSSVKMGYSKSTAYKTHTLFEFDIWKVSTVFQAKGMAKSPGDAIMPLGKQKDLWRFFPKALRQGSCCQSGLISQIISHIISQIIYQNHTQNRTTSRRRISSNSIQLNSPSGRTESLATVKLKRRTVVTFSASCFGGRALLWNSRKFQFLIS